jgi:predicted transcriptional regulator
MNAADRFLEAAASIVKRLIKLEGEREEFILAISSPSAVDPSRDYVQGGAAHDMADDVARLEDNTQRIKALKYDLLVMQGYVKRVENNHYRYLLYTHGMYGVPLLTISKTTKTPYTTLRRDYAAAKDALCKALVDWRPQR